MELCQKTSQKKTIKTISSPKKSVHPEQFILSKCRKFEARIHCKVRLRPKKLQTSHCQCPPPKRLPLPWQNMTKHDKTKEIPRSHLHSIHFEEEIKQSHAVFSRSRACRAATGGTEEASFTGKCQMYSDASSLRRLCKSLLSQHTYPIS